MRTTTIARCVGAAALALLAACGGAWGQAGIPIGGAGINPATQSVTPVPGTVASALNTVLGRTYSVLDAGAKCNVVFTAYDGAITSGMNIFTSSVVTFTAADVGKSIVINGAGASGAPLATTIAGFTNSTTVTLTANASTTVPAMQIGGAIVVTPQAGAGSYAPGDTITLTGGTESANGVLTVRNTQAANVAAWTIAAAGTYTGTTGAITVTGTTGTGIKFQANVTATNGSGITAINSITVPGAYTVNPTTLTAEPVTGANLTGATLSIRMGVLTPNVTTPGTYTVLPTNPTAQGATSGSGTGATFTTAGTIQQFWYYGNDDTAAINSAVTAAFLIGAKQINFPPQGCGIASQITLAGNGILVSPSILQGAGINSTQIFALASMTNMIERPQANYSTGGGIRDLTLNGFKLATNVLNIHGGQSLFVENVAALNATTVECLFGDGTGVGGGYHLDKIDCHTDYQYFPASARSTYNLQLNNTGDNFISNSTFYNASSANIYNNGGNNHFLSNHTYGFPNPDYYATDGINDVSGGALIHAHEFDGAATALLAMNGANTTATGNSFGWSNNTVYTAQGIVIATGQSVVVVGSKWSNTWALTSANSIVQTGTIGTNTTLAANGLAPAAYEPAYSPTIGAGCVGGNNWFYQPSINTLALCNNGNQIAQWAGQFMYLGHISANGNLQAQLQNTSGGGSAQTELDVGNVTANEFSLIVEGSGNSGGNGANSVTLNAITSMWLSGGGTNAIHIDSSGNPFLPSLANATTAKTGSVCWNTGGGALTYDGTNTCLVSSRRFKKNIAPLKNVMPKIMALKPSSFEYRDQASNPGVHHGLIAENVAAVDPTLAAFDEDGKPLKVRYLDMIADLVAAVQSQQREISSLKRRHH